MPTAKVSVLCDPGTFRSVAIEVQVLRELHANHITRCTIHSFQSVSGSKNPWLCATYSAQKLKWSNFVFYYIGRPINRSVSHDTLTPWHPCPARGIVLERPMCYHGNGAQAIPSVIAVFHLQQEKDLFPSQTILQEFVCVCVCVLFLWFEQSLFFLLCQWLQEEINRWTVFFGEWYKALLCVFVSVFAPAL